MTTTAVTTTTPATTNPVVELFTSEKARRYIEKFLPQGVDIERVAATVMLAIQNDRTNTLRRCTGESLILGVAKIAQWGLELGTTAHLLPFNNTVKVRREDGTVVDEKRFEATPVADYKGLAELMVASGAVRHVEARCVYQGDQFDYRYGLDAKIDHRPTSKMNRGSITHAYCILHLPYGRCAFEVMGVEDIEEIRKKFSKQWKEGPLPPWYAKKTVVRQTAKLVPKNPRLAAALAVMEQDREIEVDPTPGAPVAESIGAIAAVSDANDHEQSEEDLRLDRLIQEDNE